MTELIDVVLVVVYLSVSPNPATEFVVIWAAATATSVPAVMVSTRSAPAFVAADPMRASTSILMVP